jgi:transposase
MRSIALDVHRSLCEVAIKEGMKLRSGLRIKTSVAALELFAGSLGADDQVALEASGLAVQIARILEPHVGRVVVANTRKVRAIAEAKVKTDKVDAATRPRASSAWCSGTCSPGSRTTPSAGPP